MKKYLSFLTLLFFVVHVHAQYGVADIPNPKKQGQAFFVSNPDGILSAETVAQLNAQATALEAKNGVEMVVVVVNSFKGSSDFNFALTLFNQWGIGKKGADNGLLLFVAKKERAYRFISGYGVEGILPDASLKRVGERFLVPNFRAGNYDQGVLKACAFIDEVLQSADAQKELQRIMLQAVPSADVQKERQRSMSEAIPSEDVQNERSMPEAIPFWTKYYDSFRNSFLIMLLFFLAHRYVRTVGRANMGPLREKKPDLKPYKRGCNAFFMVSLFFFFLIYFFAPGFGINIKYVPYFIAIVGSIVVGVKYMEVCNLIVHSFRDDKTIQDSLIRFALYTFIPMLFSPVAYGGFYGIIQRKYKNKGRFQPPDHTGLWMRLNRDEDRARIASLLSKGQRAEEKMGSRYYEVWINTVTKKVHRQAWDASANITACTRCLFKTFQWGLQKQIKAATYTSGGLVETYCHCRFCNLRVSYGNRATEPLTRQTFSKGSGSSYSGGDSGSSGGGSSSSGGSSGGGSSGGGGAGGNW